MFVIATAVSTAFVRDRYSAPLPQRSLPLSEWSSAVSNAFSRSGVYRFSNGLYRFWVFPAVILPLSTRSGQSLASRYRARNHQAGETQILRSLWRIRKHPAGEALQWRIPNLGKPLVNQGAPSWGSLGESEILRSLWRIRKHQAGEALENPKS